MSDRNIKNETKNLSEFDRVQKMFSDKENHNSKQGLETLSKHLNGAYEILEDRLAEPNLSGKDRKSLNSQLSKLEKQKETIEKKMTLAGDASHATAEKSAEEMPKNLTQKATSVGMKVSNMLNALSNSLTHATSNTFSRSSSAKRNKGIEGRG